MSLILLYNQLFSFNHSLFYKFLQPDHLGFTCSRALSLSPSAQLSNLFLVTIPSWTWLRIFYLGSTLGRWCSPWRSVHLKCKRNRFSILSFCGYWFGYHKFLTITASSVLTQLLTRNPNLDKISWKPTAILDSNLYRIMISSNQGKLILLSKYCRNHFSTS